MTARAGWFRDPGGDELRWWDGKRWTDWVADDPGSVLVAPETPVEPAAPAMPADSALPPAPLAPIEPPMPNGGEFTVASMPRSMPGSELAAARLAHRPSSSVERASAPTSFTSVPPTVGTSAAVPTVDDLIAELERAAAPGSAPSGPPMGPPPQRGDSDLVAMPAMPIPQRPSGSASSRARRSSVPAVPSVPPAPSNPAPATSIEAQFRSVAESFRTLAEQARQPSAAPTGSGRVQVGRHGGRADAPGTPKAPKNLGGCFVILAVLVFGIGSCITSAVRSFDFDSNDSSSDVVSLPDFDPNSPAWAMEVAGACAAIIANPFQASTAVVDWNPEFGSRESHLVDLVAEVDECASPSVRSALPSALGGMDCGVVDVAAVTNGPSRYVDDCVTLTAQVERLSGSDGCSFRGVWDDTALPSTELYRGADAAFFASDTEYGCASLAGISAGSVVEVVALIDGTVGIETWNGVEQARAMFTVKQITIR